MGALAAPLAFAFATSVLSGATQVLLAGDPPDLPDLGAEEAASLGTDADEEARRRRLQSSQILAPNAVGAPQARVGTPTITLGG